MADLKSATRNCIESVKTHATENEKKCVPLCYQSEALKHYRDSAFALTCHATVACKVMGGRLSSWAYVSCEMLRNFKKRFAEPTRAWAYGTAFYWGGGAEKNLPWK